MKKCKVVVPVVSACVVFLAGAYVAMRSYHGAIEKAYLDGTKSGMWCVYRGAQYELDNALKQGDDLSSLVEKWKSRADKLTK